jgi:hypothetical protein
MLSVECFSEGCWMFDVWPSILQALKLSPQEQLVAALGFFTLKPPSCKASTKSSSLPVT